MAKQKKIIGAESFEAYYSNLYTLSVAFYMPTLALSNTTAFTLLKNNGLDTVKDFPPIRVFGTVGFIATMWFVVEIQVVHHCQAHGEHFLRHEQVADIGTAEPTAHGAVTLGINGPFVRHILGVFQIDGTLPGIQAGMLCDIVMFHP